ncbi:formin-like protein 6 [Chenopodium quinoa]|uniref:formin-like protein 6 n=1 Tax=Chenopodium quinoa TaxID=63459 RepID=UPI000B795DAF|nr:formin-like protein 6 [Chenopodium quinoa]
MALFRKFFYKKPPDGLLEIAERVYVFDCCFTTDVVEDDNYQGYIDGIVSQLYGHLPDASFMVFNFREGENQSQIANMLSEYDMTVIDYPRQHEGCPLLTLEMIHHCLRSGDSWLLLGQRNVLLMHCERGGWPILAFMLAALLIYRKLYNGEQKTLDMIYRQAPRELLQLMCPLNPIPSQLRYLQYVSRRHLDSEWPPQDRCLTVDCIMLRLIPNIDGVGGCRPILRIYGRDPSPAADRTPIMLFSTPKKSKIVRQYKQAESELVKIDVNCHVQGDVVLECISLDDDLEREQMIFRVMFSTAFIRSNILMLNRDEIDTLWDDKDKFPKDFRAEVLFSEMDSATSGTSIDMPVTEEKEGLPIEAFAKVQEIFSNVDWIDSKSDVALNVLQKITSSKELKEKLDIASHESKESLVGNLKSLVQEDSIMGSSKGTLERQSHFSSETTVETHIGYIVGQKSDAHKEGVSNIVLENLENASLPEKSSIIVVSHPQQIVEKLSKQSSGPSPDDIVVPKKGLPEDLVPVLQKTTQTKIISPRILQSSRSSSAIYSNSMQGSPKPMQRFHSSPSSLGITALLHDNDTYKSDAVAHQEAISPQSTATLVAFVPEVSKPGQNVLSSSALSQPPAPPPSSPPLPHIHSVSQHKDSPPALQPLPPVELENDIVCRTNPSSIPPPPPLPFFRSSTVQNTSFPPPLLFVNAGGALSAPPPPLPLPTSFGQSLSSNTRVPLSTPPPPPPPPPVLQSPCSSARSTLSIPSPPPLPPPRLPENVSSAIDSDSSISSTRGPVKAPPPPPPPCLPENVSSAIGSDSSNTNARGPVKAPPPPPPPPRLSENVSSAIGSDSSNTNTRGPVKAPPPPLPPKLPVSVASPKMSSLVPPPPPPPKGASSNVGSSTSIKTPPVPPPPGPLGKGVARANSSAQDSQVAGSKGPVPPPPGPTGLKGRVPPRVTPRNQGQPKKNVKPFHWLKLTRVMQGSLWADAQKPDEASKAPEFDMSELETLFAASVPNADKGITGGQSGRRTSGSKPEKIQLIELRRAYNCEIMFTKVKIPLPDLMNSVLALDDSALDVDQVENLIKFCPTKEEMEQLKGYKGDKDNLGKCEQFFLELMKVPRVESKLRVFSFKIQFISQVSDLRKNLQIVSSASEEIRTSVKLKRVMQTILSLGNALNQGTARGAAVGFRLDSLLKLTDTRSRNSKMTLMHYLCKILADQLPEVLDFPKDLANLEGSTKIQLKILAEEMQAISKGLEKVVQELTASGNDGNISECFCTILKRFLSYAEGEVRSLASLYSIVGRNADALAMYFGEDPAKVPFEQVVSTLQNFVRMFHRAHDENCKQLEFEKKKAEKEAENEKSKMNARAKDPDHHVQQLPRKFGTVK